MNFYIYELPKCLLTWESALGKGSGDHDCGVKKGHLKENSTFNF